MRVGGTIAAVVPPARGHSGRAILAAMNATDRRFLRAAWPARPRLPPPTGCSPATRGRPSANYFTDSTQQFFAGRWSSTPRQVAHPLFRVRVLLPHPGPRGARKSGGRALGIRSRRRLRGACRASRAPGKSSKTAPSSTPSSRRALKTCIGLGHSRHNPAHRSWLCFLCLHLTH